MRGGSQSPAKGSWSEFIISLLFEKIARELNGNPISSHPIFSELRGSIFDNYTLLTTETIFQQDIWEKIFQQHETSIIGIQLDSFLRWDLFFLLKKLKKYSEKLDIPEYAIVIVACKLVRDITNDIFFENILSSIASRGFLNSSNKVLSKKKEKN